MTSKGWFFGAALLSAGLAACGGHLPGDGPGPSAVDAGATINTGSTIDFVPRAVYANRYPNACGVANPPFGNGDLFTLQIVGAIAAGPSNSLEIDVDPPHPAVGAPLALAVMDFTPQGTGVTDPGTGTTTWYAFQYATAGSVRFLDSQGVNPSEIDPGAFDAATVTILRMPAANGDPFTVRLQVHFADGNLLDETFSAATATVASGCPAG